MSESCCFNIFFECLCVLFLSFFFRLLVRIWWCDHFQSFQYCTLLMNWINGHWKYDGEEFFFSLSKLIETEYGIASLYSNFTIGTVLFFFLPSLYYYYYLVFIFLHSNLTIHSNRICIWFLSIYSSLTHKLLARSVDLYSLVI